MFIVLVSGGVARAQAREPSRWIDDVMAQREALRLCADSPQRLGDTETREYSHVTELSTSRAIVGLACGTTVNAVLYQLVLVDGAGGEAVVRPLQLTFKQRNEDGSFTTTHESLIAGHLTVHQDGASVHVNIDSQGAWYGTEYDYELVNDALELNYIMTREVYWSREINE
jgi:hypothetical protein